MNPTNESGDGNSFTRVLIAVVVVVFGAGTVGSIAKYKADTAQERPIVPASVTTATSGPEAKSTSEKAKEPDFDARGLLRPLGLMRRFLGPEPLFRSEGTAEHAPLTPFESAALAAYNEERSRGEAATPELDAPLYGSAPSPQDRAAIRTAVEKLKQQEIQSTVVLAALPDWVDSSLQWTFDSMLDAIQMSAAQMGYVLTAFDLPDSRGTSSESPTPEKTARSLRRIHESVPGSLLFRRVNPAPGSDRRTWNCCSSCSSGKRRRMACMLGRSARALDLALVWNAEMIREGSGSPRQPDPASPRPGAFESSGRPIRVRRSRCDEGSRPRPKKSSSLVPMRASGFEVVTPSASNRNNPSLSRGERSLDLCGR